MLYVMIIATAIHFVVLWNYWDEWSFRRECGRDHVEMVLQLQTLVLLFRENFLSFFWFTLTYFSITCRPYLGVNLSHEFSYFMMYIIHLTLKYFLNKDVGGSLFFYREL